jgi:hypothetical protein
VIRVVKLVIRLLFRNCSALSLQGYCKTNFVINDVIVVFVFFVERTTPLISVPNYVVFCFCRMLHRDTRRTMFRSMKNFPDLQVIHFTFITFILLIPVNLNNLQRTQLIRFLTEKRVGYGSYTYPVSCSSSMSRFFMSVTSYEIAPVISYQHFQASVVSSAACSLREIYLVWI